MNRSHCIRMLLLLEPTSCADLVAYTGWERKTVHNTIAQLSTKEHVRFFEGEWHITEKGARCERMTDEERTARFGKQFAHKAALQYRSVFEIAGQE